MTIFRFFCKPNGEWFPLGQTCDLPLHGKATDWQLKKQKTNMLSLPALRSGSFRGLCAASATPTCMHESDAIAAIQAHKPWRR